MRKGRDDNRGISPSERVWMPDRDTAEVVPGEIGVDNADDLRTDRQQFLREVTGTEQDTWPVRYVGFDPVE